METSIQPISANRVRVEHFEGDTLGLDTAEPRLSWTYAGVPDAGTAVYLQVERMQFAATTFQRETVQVEADANRLHAWPFSPLESRELVRVSVGVRNDDAVVILWSPPVTFEAGLLDPSLLNATMVGPSWVETGQDGRRPAVVTRDLTLSSAPVKARLYVSAHGLVEAEINATKVGEDILVPGWTCYEDRLLYSTYDVTEDLSAGVNRLTFWLADGWFRGRLGFDGGQADIYGEDLGVWARLDLLMSDGHSISVCSDADDGQWRAAPSPIISSGLCEGESYDARESITLRPADLIDSAVGFQPVAQRDFDSSVLAPQAAAPVRRVATSAPAGVKRVGQAAFMVDTGANRTQRLRLRLSGLTAGDRVRIRHAEVLETDGSLSTRPLRRGVQIDEYVSDGIDTWWEPRFTIHGFRYAEITGLSDLRDEDVECRVYSSDLERTGWFRCSDGDVNLLHENVVRSMRSNFVSIPMDCPQRDERFGWTGDITQFGMTAEYLFDTSDFLDSWLKDVAVETRKWGTAPYYVPFVPLAEWKVPEPIAIWGDAVVVVPWVLYLNSGDRERLATQYPQGSAWVDQVAALLAEDGVWDRQPELVHGQLADWLDPTAPPDDPARAMTAKELVSTAFFARSCELMARMALDLGREADAARFEKLAGRVRSGFRTRFVRADGTMTSDTQCAYALGICFGLLDPDELAVAGQRLADLVTRSGFVVGTGFAGTPFVLPALTRTGHADVAYSLLLSHECPSWLYQVDMGATTWERWDSMLPDGSVNPGDMTSFNHYALGSVAEWMHNSIGGLEPLDPAWDRFAVRPVPGGGITWAETSHLTPRGLAKVAWRIEGATVRVNVEVPPGAHAEVDVSSERRTLAGGVHELLMTL